MHKYSGPPCLIYHSRPRRRLILVDKCHREHHHCHCRCTIYNVQASSTLSVVKERVTLLPHSHSCCCQKILDQICCKKILEPRPYSRWKQYLQPEHLALAQGKCLDTTCQVKKIRLEPCFLLCCKNSVHPWCISMLYTTIDEIIQCPYEVLRTW